MDVNNGGNDIIDSLMEAPEFLIFLPIAHLYRDAHKRTLSFLKVKTKMLEYLFIYCTLSFIKNVLIFTLTVFSVFSAEIR